jgi:ubiquitin-like protein Pup
MPHEYKQKQTAKQPAPEIEQQETTAPHDFTDEVDDILDEIDEVLEVNAEEFVNSYIQKGGQ